MLLSDLLDLPVHDQDDRRIGWIIDLRFRILDTSAADETIARPQLMGVLVSPRRRSSYLGFERADVRSPRLLAGWIRWRHRDTYLVPWTDVEQVQTSALTLRRGYRRRPPQLNP
ncbi:MULTISPECIES: hypothetical protein [Rhodococcus]|uniref:hypothetical protein n=1 Tax=Rhodococcus TaxID=1827 RepID=UPI0002D226B4|nr:hypothetical protein [Rhodococcus aetherivorans]NCL73171.1 hypothetical protein [Rhodococcus sp. YH1]WFS11157.1 hypothetical protein P9K37_15130 [Rhodococcus aetherivorans]CCW10014.1 hypothetical protein EBESD8_5420 [Rhodococcus aetherivorans]